MKSHFTKYARTHDYTTPSIYPRALEAAIEARSPYTQLYDIDFGSLSRPATFSRYMYKNHAAQFARHLENKQRETSEGERCI
jgi:hypothetical protein